MPLPIRKGNSVLFNIFRPLKEETVNSRATFLAPTVDYKSFMGGSCAHKVYPLIHNIRARLFPVCIPYVSLLIRIAHQLR